MYIIGNKLNKRVKLGIHREIEHVCLQTMTLLLDATFSEKSKKLEQLEKSRVLLEVLKNLIRTEYELKIIPEKTYVYLETLIIDTSKQNNGWLKSIKTP